MKENTNHTIEPLPQDLHIHTTFSAYDSSVEPQQTLELIAAVGHAQTIGISDHFDHFYMDFEAYRQKVQHYGFKLGTEIDGDPWVDEAAALPFDYYVYHCRDEKEEYQGLERLLATGKPVIVAHPMVFMTDMRRVPPEAFVEINNRYVWRSDWKSFYPPLQDTFRFVIGSDAHKPNWLNHQVARYVARELQITETLLFEDD